MLHGVNFTPETAVLVSQIVVMLLVATMLGPWAKQVLAPRRRHRRHRWLQVTSWLSYFSKVFALFGLLINMQAVSLLLVALSHMGVFALAQPDTAGRRRPRRALISQ